MTEPSPPADDAAAHPPAAEVAPSDEAPDRLSRREVLRRASIAGAFAVGGGVIGHEFVPHRHAAADAISTGGGHAAGPGYAAGSGYAAAAPPVGLVSGSAGAQSGLYGHHAGPPTSLRQDELDACTYPPAYDGRAGMTREYDLSVTSRQVAVADGTVVDAWTYNGSVPGPTLRATEGDRLRIRMANLTSHAHNVHLHGRHDPAMDGWEPIPPGEEFTYELTAAPFGLHPYHCHIAPVAEHVGRGLYGAMIVDPPGGRPPAREVVLVLGGWDLNGDGRNDLVCFNGVAGAYHRFPITVAVGELVRVYLVNLLEHDPIASFHLHAQTFDVYRSGTSLEPDTHTDVVALSQGERAIVEFRLPERGRYMFHPHQSRLANRGAMGWFAAV
jgi:nitrite reductase (NO-forming)